MGMVVRCRYSVHLMLMFVFLDIHSASGGRQGTLQKRDEGMGGAHDRTWEGGSRSTEGVEAQEGGD